MKKLLLILLLPLIAFAQTPVKFAGIVVTNAGTTSEKIVSTNFYALTGFTFIGMKNDSVSNSATIYIGPSTNSAALPIIPGGSATLFVTPGTKVNLSDWWVKGAAGDAVTVIAR